MNPFLCLVFLAILVNAFNISIAFASDKDLVDKQQEEKQTLRIIALAPHIVESL